MSSKSTASGATTWSATFVPKDHTHGQHGQPFDGDNVGLQIEWTHGPHSLVATTTTTTTVKSVAR